MTLSRLIRSFGCGLATAFCAATMLAAPACAQDASQAQFSKAVVEEMAKSLATKAYVPPPEALPKGAENLDYDQFRQIRFRKERTIWRGEGSNFELQVLPSGWLFKTPVEINLVEGGVARLLAPDQSYFDQGPLAGKLAPEDRLGFSGFRITNPMNRPDLFDEVIVFQGASYFRALSRNQVYGLSARGLAVNIGSSDGEEFPAFRRFWIEKPAAGATTVTIHALLDSPSVTGAYLFRVTPGSPTVTEVQATLIPRKDLANVGIAPLTSMFLFSDIDRRRISDFRPAVHDSDGLAVVNGWGENLWRPLTNPKRLQTSSFLDNNPRGYGLIQRARAFSEFQDLEAGYEKRPSAWVEPLQPWGSGAVELFEIPTEEEIHDNIVAYWKPGVPLKAGHAHNFNYRLTWPNDAPRRWPGAFVHATRSGLVNGPQRSTGALQYAVDFKGLPPAALSDLPQAKLEVSAGSVSPPIVQANPHIDGLRVSFSFDPKGATASEFRLVLQVNDKAVSETWLHRWTKG